VVHVASSQRSRGSEAKDSWFDGVGCGAVEVGPNYPFEKPSGQFLGLFVMSH
jgi:hypothetical protein